MRTSANELDAAATNILVVATFWRNYAAVRGGNDEQSAIRVGIVQVMMLLAPFLRDAERVHLHTSDCEPYPGTRRCNSHPSTPKRMPHLRCTTPRSSARSAR